MESALGCVARTRVRHEQDYAERLRARVLEVEAIAPVQGWMPRRVTAEDIRLGAHGAGRLSSQLLGWVAPTFCLPGQAPSNLGQRLYANKPLGRRLAETAALPSQFVRGGRTRLRKRRLRRSHEGSCLSEDSPFDLCGCLLCFGDCVFGGAFPLTGMRAVLAAASASKRLSALRSVTVVLLIDKFRTQHVLQRGGRRQLRSSSLRAPVAFWTAVVSPSMARAIAKSPSTMFDGSPSRSGSLGEISAAFKAPAIWVWSFSIIGLVPFRAVAMMLLPRMGWRTRAGGSGAFEIHQPRNVGRAACASALNGRPT